MPGQLEKSNQKAQIFKLLQPKWCLKNQYELQLWALKEVKSEVKFLCGSFPHFSPCFERLRILDCPLHKKSNLRKTCSCHKNERRREARGKCQDNVGKSKKTHKFSGNLMKSSSIGHWWSSSNCLRQVHAHILHPVKIYRAVLNFIDA